MTEQKSQSQPFLQRNAWIMLLVVASIFTLFGVWDIIRGMEADPAIAESILGVGWEAFRDQRPDAARLIDLMAESQGATIAAFSIMSIAIILRPFRRSEPWAWYALWLWPVWNVMIFLRFFTADRSPDFAAPPPMLSSPIFFTVTTLALIGSCRAFFPRSQKSGESSSGSLSDS